MDGLRLTSVNPGLDISKVGGSAPSGRTGPSDGPSFSETLNKAIKEVDYLQKDADLKAQKLATGESRNIPEVLIATERADIALKLMVQVRNKVIDAYNEIMKMQV